MREDRLEVLSRISQYEEEGRFDEDVENDPPSREIKPGEVDYPHKKWRSKVKAKYAFHIARKFLNRILKNKEMIVKDIVGIENFNSINSGAIMVCNHFNAFDSFAIQMAFEKSNHFKKSRFFRVIREGNYTSFPGFYGKLMRDCNTLPLSSNRKTMEEFLSGCNEILKDGDYILVYAEQSMWWNYRKPKPLKKSAYKIAVKANVPVAPFFICMEDSDIMDPDGFPIQEYTIFCGKPIYPDANLSLNDNVQMMMEKNQTYWKEVYESFYHMPLTYTTKEKVKEN